MRKTAQAAILTILSLLSLLPAQANELALRNASKVPGAVNVPIQGLVNFNGITQEQLYKTRSNAVYKYKSFLSDMYEPSDSIFGMCESKKPWWGVWGMQVFREGAHAIDGPSKESDYILNPFRLVAAEANSIGLWGRGVTENDLHNPAFPFLWESGPVTFNAKLASAQVTYDITKFNKALLQYQDRMRAHRTAITGFSLIAYNARDFGYRYIYLDPHKSIGIKRWPSVGAVEITQFLHCGGSCGYPGGCNNMSPHVREFDENTLLQLPARAHLKLWKSEPESVSDAPDFTYIIDFK